MAKTKTRKTRQPRPIPAMLEGAFSTRLENIIAEMNNTLARENRLTNDPAFVMLMTVRKELVKEGIATFQRSGVETAPAPAPKSSKVKGTNGKSDTPPAAPSAVREIEESELEALAVDDTVSDEAPYGRDSKGIALAPYGVKLSGVPKKRRGRKAVEEAPGSETTETTDDTPEAEASGADSETEEETETEEEVEENDDSDDDSDDDLEDVDEDDLDDLLADL